MLFIIIFQFNAALYIAHINHHIQTYSFSRLIFGWCFESTSITSGFQPLVPLWCPVCWLVCTILHLPSMHLRSCQGIVYTFIPSFWDVCGKENVRYHWKQRVTQTTSFAPIINDNFDTFFLTFAQLSQGFWTKRHLKLFILIKLVRKLCRGQLVLWRSQRSA